jgi:hypothetical protein
MLIKNLFVLSLALVALCCSNVGSIGDPDGKTVDQLINESNGIYIHDINHPENPQEARMLWSRARGINFTMPSRLSENVTGPEASKISAQTGEGTRHQIAGTANSAKNQTSQNVSSSQAAGAAGNWSVRLKDS